MFATPGTGEFREVGEALDDAQERLERLGVRVEAAAAVAPNRVQLGLLRTTAERARLDVAAMARTVELPTTTLRDLEPHAPEAI